MPRSKLVLILEISEKTRFCTINRLYTIITIVSMIFIPLLSLSPLPSSISTLGRVISPQIRIHTLPESENLVPFHSLPYEAYKSHHCLNMMMILTHHDPYTIYYPLHSKVSTLYRLKCD